MHKPADPSTRHMANALQSAQAQQAEHHHEEADEFYDSEEDGDVFETLDDAPVRIETGLFIGSMMSEGNRRALQAAGVTHVVQVGSHCMAFT